MRTLLMAGTVVMMLGGVALAQSTSGNAPAMGGQSGMSNSAGSMMHHTTGANSTMPSQKGSEMGKKMSGKSSMISHHSSMGHNTAYISHHMGGNMPMGAPASTYLHIAQSAIAAHNKVRAHDALGRAETDMLTNSYVEGSVSGPINTPAISAVRDARTAVDGGQYNDASAMIQKAMAGMHGGMMNNGQMNNGQSGGMMSK